MVAPLLAILALAAARQAEDPGRLVQHAVAAVEGDSVAVVRNRWSRRLARDSSDRHMRLGLAALAQHTYQDSIAEPLYRSLLAMDGPADTIAGYAALYLARQMILRGQWLRADSFADRAVAVSRGLRDPVLSGEAFLVLANVRHRTRSAAEALALLDSADAVLPAAAFRERSLAKCTRAQVYSFVSDARSLSEVETGIALADSAASFRARAACRNIKAGELSRRGDADSAISAYHYLIADYRRARDRAGLAISLQWRAHFYRSIGWLARSRRDAQEAIVEAEASGVGIAIPWAQTTLAFASLQLGDLAGAAPYAAAARERFAGQGDRYATVTALGLEGYLAVATGDLATARKAYTDALARSEALSWAESEINLHTALMNLALREGDLVTAQREVAARGARARAARMEGFVSSNRYYEGVVALRMGRLDLAEQIFRTRSAAAQRAQPNWLYLDAARLAEVLVRRGRPAEAQRALATASKALDNWRSDLRDRELRLFALQVSEDPSDPDIGIATVINGLARAKMEYEAFGLIEEIRARDIADRLTRAAALDTSGDRAIRTDRISSMQAVMHELPDSTALLRFVTGRGNEPTTVFVIHYGDFASFHLPPEDALAPVIARFVALLESGEDARALGQDLAKALLEDVTRYLKPSIRRLIIVPDGALARVPFDALVLADGRFVLEHYAVSYAPSATAAIALARKQDRGGAATLVLADPRFAGETRASAAGVDVFRSAVAGRGALPRLPGSAREARAVARYSDDATVRRRDQASEAWIKHNALTRFGVVHFATHALVDEASVTNTALALAPGDGEDGFMNAGELLNLRLAADLVVLSACRTAGGLLVRGEGVQGLANPLLAAGARAVAATWWPIGDAASVRLVDDFYRELATGHAVSEALRQAKLAALQRGAPAREWAAFTIIGDPSITPQLRIPARHAAVWWYVAAAMVVVLGIYGVAIRRRRTVDAG